MLFSEIQLHSYMKLQTAFSLYLIMFFMFSESPVQLAGLYPLGNVYFTNLFLLMKSALNHKQLVIHNKISDIFRHSFHF